MPIVTISRGSYNYGKSVAEKVAKKLGYECLSRDEIIENLNEFHLPEIKLVRGLNDAFSVLDRFPHGKQRFKAAIRAEILKRFNSGNVVYHGLVGHHFVNNISHVLKVRILGDRQTRITGEMERENVSLEQARALLEKDDEERRRWVKFLYGIDLLDAESYNIVLRIGHLCEDEAVDIIANTVKLQSFQETEASRALLADAALEALIAHKLFDFPNAAVKVSKQKVHVSLKIPENQQMLIKDRVTELLESLDEVHEFELNFEPYY